SSRLLQVTVSPAAISSVAGANLKFSIWTAAVAATARKSWRALYFIPGYSPGRAVWIGGQKSLPGSWQDWGATHRQTGRPAMNFDIPRDIAAYLVELDEFIEREIKPLENKDDNI